MNPTIIATALLLLTGIVTVPAFALDSEFDVYITDYDKSHTYRTCMTEAGSLPVQTDCVYHTGLQLETGEIPYFIAQGAEPGLRVAISVEDTTNKTIFYQHIDDLEENPEDILFPMRYAEPGTTQFATEEGVQTETQTETVTETETQTGTTTWTDPDTGLVYDIPTQGDYCLDFDGDSVCDIDFTDGKQVVYDVETETDEEVEDAVGESGSNRDSDDNERPPSDLPY